MAEVLKSDKGFLLIHTSRAEVIEVANGLGICDRCARPKEEGYIVCVLAARWYCPECYEAWHKKAVNFKEDREYERIIFYRYRTAFSLPDLNEQPTHKEKA